MSFPQHGEPEDIDGSGTWTVAGFHTEIPGDEWQAIKARHRNHLIMHISDDPATDPPRFRHDPVAVGQEILGWAIAAPVILAFLSVLAGFCYLWATH